MFSSIKISCSETGDLDLPGRGVTLFVGPNNSGKSLLLREIEQCSNVHPAPSDLKLVKDYDIHWPSREQVDRTMDAMKQFHHPNGGLYTCLTQSQISARCCDGDQ